MTGQTHPDTLARAREQIALVGQADNKRLHAFRYGHANGWLQAVYAEGLLVAADYSALLEELDAFSSFTAKEPTP